ncbi:calmodulin-lysine N-methyltransferase [Anopheles ziemanni]|uniref:calmodulin-lysine N-methyltransferase n=1 Tax=Anopheles coustani TaxID=139045 RepID=UPI0026583D1E|nr:calmodulin-lysine N-methyltransferase [Anopheles coustani]XP_058177088.1 calmodulin-lysine N-methyltransferase [Anopheles ziemanni]
MTVKKDERHEDDINWKMSTEQQVTPAPPTGGDGRVLEGVVGAPPAEEPGTVAVDGENNPIKSLRRQRHCDTGPAVASTTSTSITASTMPIASDTPDRHRLRRVAAIGYDDDDDEDGCGDDQRTPEGGGSVRRATVCVSDGKNSPGHDTTNNNRFDPRRMPRNSGAPGDGGGGDAGGRDTMDALEQKQHKTINARRRWKLLAKALRHDSSEDDQLLKFNLIEADRAGDEKDENVYVYRLYDRYRLKIRLIGPERPWTASELIGFNNTGNICVWPSEEALAYYVLSRLAQFEGTRVLELGGGMTCLAGLVLAKYGQPAFVHVTDGNELSVENVRKSLVLNKFNCTIKSSVLKWEQTGVLGPQPGDHRYQFILSADCLFFDESRSQLIDAIWMLLADEGVALITAPRRGHTLSQFLDECVARGFHYELLQCYNEAIWARHLELKLSEGYDENIHYPLLVKMYKYAHGPVLHRL